MKRNDLEEREIVMNSTMIFKNEEILKLLPYCLFLLICTSCGSAKFVPTKDICLIKKHWKDNVFQIQVNNELINPHWYIHKDALNISRRLVSQNKCMK